MMKIIVFRITPLEMNALQYPSYNPVPLLDRVFKHLGISSDYRLSQLLGTSSANICRIRHKRVGMSNDVILGLHELTGFSIAEIKKLAGLPSWEDRNPTEVDFERLT